MNEKWFSSSWRFTNDIKYSIISLKTNIKMFTLMAGQNQYHYICLNEFPFKRKTIEIFYDLLFPTRSRLDQSTEPI